jgi:hypothetical protein
LRSWPASRRATSSCSAFSSDPRAGEQSRQAAAELGIALPLSANLSADEESRVWNRIYARMLAAEVERATARR